MESNFDSPISTLKVDFGCSRDCPADVKNMLGQLKGVKAISIDPNEGKVTVVGNVNPMMLIKLLQRMGKKAQLWSFDKAPQQKRYGSHPKKKQTSHCCEISDSDSDDTDVHGSYTDWKHGKSKKKHSMKYQFSSADKYAASPQPPVTGYHHAPMSGYQPFTEYHHQPMMLGYQPFRGYTRPLTYPRPLGPNYGYYGQVQPPMSSTYRLHPHARLYPEHNPMVHYSSYADNYRYPGYM